MKTKPIIMLSFLLLSFTSCVTLTKWKYGITDPKEQTLEKLISFLEKHQYPTEDQYMFSDSGSYNRAIRNNEFRKNLFSNMIFDREGALLQRDTTQCQWSGNEKIKTLKPDSVYERCSGLSLGHILPYIVPVDAKVSQEIERSDPDFTIIVTWAKFLGDYNHRLFDLSEALNLNNTASIRIIWLNIDMQESWKLTPAQKVAFK